MSLSKPIRRVAVVGTGVIGASWVTHYLSRGFEVVATDPAPNAESNAVAPPDSILASSSSGIPMDVIQLECEHPERCVIGHPSNPPNIVPLVEVVGRAKTS